MSYQPGAKFKIGNETIIDLTGDTVTPETLKRGVTAHRSNGQQITGTYADKFSGYGVAVKDTVNGGYTVQIDGITAISAGMMIAVKFPEHIETNSDAELNVNSLGKMRLAFLGYKLRNITTDYGTQKIFDAHSPAYVGKDGVVFLVADNATVTQGTTGDLCWNIVNPHEITYFGKCNTASATAAKTVSIPGVFDIYEGLTIKVMFAYANSASNPTLSVNGFPAVRIIRNANYASNTAAGSWQQMAVVSLTYIVNSGVAYWSMNDWNNSTYSNASLGHVYATCDTVDSGTGECTVVAANYAIGAGAVLAVAFSVNVPAGATLNINDKGAKALHYKGAIIADGVIKSGDKATIIYDGTQYVLLAIDRWASANNAGRGFAMVTVTSRDDSEYPAIINATADANFQETEGGIIVLYTGSAYEAVQYDDLLSINGGTPRGFDVGYYALQSGVIGADDMAILVYSGGAYHVLGTLSAMWAGKNAKPTTYAQMSGVSVIKQSNMYLLRGIATPDAGGYKLDTGTIIVFNLSADATATYRIYYDVYSDAYYDLRPIKKPNGSGGFEFVTALSAGIHKMVMSDIGACLID